jgi:hypothetical protein
LTGVFVPFFSLWKAENFQRLNDWTEGRFQPTFLQGMQFITLLAAVGLAFHFTNVFRVEAKKEIAKLQD